MRFQGTAVLITGARVGIGQAAGLGFWNGWDSLPMGTLRTRKTRTR